MMAAAVVFCAVLLMGSDSMISPIGLSVSP